MGERRLLTVSTLSSDTSTAITQLFCANNVAIESPTYPNPATAIVLFKIYLLLNAASLAEKFSPVKKFHATSCRPCYNFNAIY